MELILNDGKCAVPISVIGLHLQCTIGHDFGQTECRLVSAEQCDSPELFWSTWRQLKTFDLVDDEGRVIEPRC